ncbi:hypothetical protein [Streptomyces niger]|uniref:hypothetical protein n=1 Tax=Streptomyces niger TaxID=66373 RepID=UPI0018FE1399|nr:hypothetical protein [Streptomyces niger]
MERRTGAGAGEEAGAEVTTESLGAWLRERGLAPHKLPERVEVVDALPRGATLRKVLKAELRARFTPGACGVTGTCGATGSEAAESGAPQGRKDVDACS